jgi:hypothetical protein
LRGSVVKLFVIKWRCFIFTHAAVAQEREDIALDADEVVNKLLHERGEGASLLQDALVDLVAVVLVPVIA